MSSSALSSCQSSFTDFLYCLSGKASEIAVEAVNHLIEDQVADPVKLEYNIYRMKSALSRCCIGLHGGGDYGAGDCQNDETKILLSVPRKVRQHIWKYLDDNSVKTLRSVCQQLKHEMDYDVGVSVVLAPESFNSLWMRSVSIRSCFVKRMNSIFMLNLFAKPEKLERISFDPEVFIDANMAELIIRKFRNLRQILLYTEDVTVVRNIHEEGMTNGVSSRMITRLEDQFQLISLDVKFDTTRWKLKWNIKLRPQVSQTQWEVQNVVGSFGISGISRVPLTSRDLSKKSLKNVTLSIPFVQDRDRFIWLKVLHTQNNLVSLTCDLNATHWKDYEGVIRKNKRSLKKLFLMNFTDDTATIVGEATEENTCIPFDWSVFDGCFQLEDITLIADTFLHSSVTNVIIPEKGRRYMESVNIKTLACPKLRALWIENFSLQEDELEFLKYADLERRDAARYEHCTLKNCKLGVECVDEEQIGSRRGRNRCMEYLYFGTLSYDDDNLDAFEKFTAAKLAKIHEGEDKDFEKTGPMDMIEYFQLASQKPLHRKNLSVRKILCENMNWFGGIAFTVWLACAK